MYVYCNCTNAHLILQVVDDLKACYVRIVSGTYIYMHMHIYVATKSVTFNIALNTEPNIIIVNIS
jgi:hypothetical protein